MGIFFSANLLKYYAGTAIEGTGVVANGYPHTALFFGDLGYAGPVVCHNDFVALHYVPDKVVGDICNILLGTKEHHIDMVRTQSEGVWSANDTLCHLLGCQVFPQTTCGIGDHVVLRTQFVPVHFPLGCIFLHLYNVSLNGSLILGLSLNLKWDRQ